MSGQEIDVDDLVGGEFDFYGVDGQRFNLDGLVYEVDDEGDVSLVNDHSGFHAIPIARVVVEHDCVCCDVYVLVDLHDGHEWLRFGTGYDDEGEMHFDVFDYTPKPPLD